MRINLQEAYEDKLQQLSAQKCFLKNHTSHQRLIHRGTVLANGLTIIYAESTIDRERNDRKLHVTRYIP